MYKNFDIHQRMIFVFKLGGSNGGVFYSNCHTTFYETNIETSIELVLYQPICDSEYSKDTCS